MTTVESAVWNHQVAFALFMTWNGLRVYPLLDNGNAVTIDWWLDVYDEDIGPWCAKQFDRDWYNYVDNCSAHCQGTQASIANKEEFLHLLADYGGQPVEPPPRSADANKIEKMNACVKAGAWKWCRYRGIRRPTQDQIIAAVQDTVAHFPLEQVRAVIRSYWCDNKTGEFTGSVYHRLIKSKGKPIDYIHVR